MTFVLAAQAATVPTAPVINVTAAGPNSLTLGLVTPSVEPVYGIRGYDIYVSSNGGFLFTKLATAVNFPFIATSLISGKAYQLIARGVSAAAGLYRSGPSPTVTGNTTGGGPPPTLRRYFPDWQTVLEFAQLDGSSLIPNGGTVTGTYPNTHVSGSVVSSAGPVCTGATSLAVHVNWKQLDNGDGTFNFDLTDKWITQCRGLNVALFLIIATRSFGGNPSTAPADLDAYGENYTGAIQSGWQVWRWSPHVLLRWQQVCTAFGNRYNADPNWGGITTQETATGGASGAPGTGTYTVSLGALGNYTGTDHYTVAGFQAAIVMEQAIIATASPNGRGICLVNDINGAGDNLAALLVIVPQLKKWGTILAGPDLVTDLSGNGLLNKTYPAYTAYHALGGLTMCSIQQPEWSGNKAPPQHPPLAGSTGPPAVYKNPSIPDLYNWGTATVTYPVSPLTGARDHSPTAPVSQRSPFKLDGFLVNWVTGKNTNGDNFQNAAAPIMAAQHGFGTVAPNP